MKLNPQSALIAMVLGDPSYPGRGNQALKLLDKGGWTSSFSPVVLKSEISFCKFSVSGWFLGLLPLFLKYIWAMWCFDGVIFQTIASTLFYNLAVFGCFWFFFLLAKLHLLVLKQKQSCQILPLPFPVISRWPVGDHQLLIHSSQASLFNLCPCFQSLHCYPMLQLHTVTGDTMFQFRQQALTTSW